MITSRPALISRASRVTASTEKGRVEEKVGFRYQHQFAGEEHARVFLVCHHLRWWRSWLRGSLHPGRRPRADQVAHVFDKEDIGLAEVDMVECLEDHLGFWIWHIRRR